jgi:hypothetical protein
MRHPVRIIRTSGVRCLAGVLLRSSARACNTPPDPWASPLISNNPESIVPVYLNRETRAAGR